MNYDQYDDLIKSIAQKPDDLTLHEQLRNAIKEDTTLLNATLEELDKKEARVKELQETNMNLFLRQTATPNPVAQDPDEALKSVLEQMGVKQNA